MTCLFGDPLWNDTFEAVWTQAVISSNPLCLSNASDECSHPRNSTETFNGAFPPLRARMVSRATSWPQHSQLQPYRTWSPWHWHVLDAMPLRLVKIILARLRPGDDGTHSGCQLFTRSASQVWSKWSSGTTNWYCPVESVYPSLLCTTSLVFLSERLSWPWHQPCF